jgi:hypothetical protein
LRKWRTSVKFFPYKKRLNAKIDVELIIIYGLAAFQSHNLLINIVSDKFYIELANSAPKSAFNPKLSILITQNDEDCPLCNACLLCTCLQTL